MTDKTVLHRQVHPSFIIDNVVSSQVFKNFPSIASSVFNPTPKDDNKLSVYNGDKYSAKKSYDHYTQNFQSKGVVSVTIEECKSIELECVEDNIPFDGHTYIDFKDLSKNQVSKKAKRLKSFATSRGWSYQPKE